MEKISPSICLSPFQIKSQDKYTKTFQITITQRHWREVKARHILEISKAQGVLHNFTTSIPRAGPIFYQVRMEKDLVGNLLSF